MKTITLKEAYNLHNDQSAGVDLARRAEATNMLYYHAIKVLPQVVEALEHLEDALHHAGYCQMCPGTNEEGHEPDCWILKARAAIEKANQVELP